MLIRLRTREQNDFMAINESFSPKSSAGMKLTDSSCSSRKMTFTETSLSSHRSSIKILKNTMRVVSTETDFEYIHEDVPYRTLFSKKYITCLLTG